MKNRDFLRIKAGENSVKFPKFHNNYIKGALYECV